MIKHPRNTEVSNDFLADNERLIETRDPSFWNPCADSEWAYVGVPLSSCEAVSGPREVKKIDCTGVLSESVKAFFQEFAREFVGSENSWWWGDDNLLRKRFHERATEAINNLVCLGSGERPSFLMRERMRWLVKLGTSCGCPSQEDELVKCLEESNRPQDKALLYIFLGKWIGELQRYLDLVSRQFSSKRISANNKLQCATRQRALLSCFHAFDAGAEVWRIELISHPRWNSHVHRQLAMALPAIVVPVETSI